MTTDIDLTDAVRPSRRTFLKAAGAVAAVGLTIGFEWAGTGRRALAATIPDATFAPNAFLRVAPDNSVTVIAKHVEMGQGAYTGIATIVAEELDANWQDVRVESAPADAKRYANLAFGTIQGTGGSSAMANSWMQLRDAGAKARAMLVSAAAAQWKVPASELTTRDGNVHHAATNRTATYGSLASAASRLPVPDTVTLKSPKDFRLIGHQLPRVDVPPKTNGTAQFTLDVTFPGMLVALLQRPPLFGATVKSFDASAAKAVPGVVSVVQVPGGVAVVAKGFWAAKQGRDALKVEWDDSKAEKRSSDAIMAEYRQLAEQPGASARKDGDATQALAGAAKKISATYTFPYLAHAPMEPLDAVVKLTPDSCEIWAGDQFQTVDQGNAARTAGLDPQQVKIHTLYAGGSFGRRANTQSDYIVEAVSIAKALGANGTPVKLQWTREDDIHGGLYRPMYFHKLDAGLTADGKLVAWQHRIVGQSILAGTPFASVMVKNGIDGTSVEGAANVAYAIPNISVELTTTQTGVPVLWWRVVGSSHTAFAVEAFIDEAAHAAGKDPFVFRRDLLEHEPRMQAVLELAAQKAGWDPAKPSPKGRGRGIAVAEAFKTFVAQVAEVSVDKDGNVKVERVVCAVDCGTPINPDVIAAQMEGGIGFGLGAALHSAITLKDGKVEQNNFDGYQVLRIAEMPKVEVHIVQSGEAPTGVGEPGVAPVGPAVANAIFAATGRRIQSLPFLAASEKTA
ncbi:Isoquinoline 1-oxidoreductase subunit beta [Paraburkholderia domus]|jgi:Aerobic-type carbon monoxide dehydrogenase, large subunit CoxL/CutL homologs|uniref:Isoquinoline 1-oxidoreductase subunit beta n=1 Tax=Paraburkholderia domus TaxID=2793075 RepID=A0A9N8MKS2_9BURK|nr:xanthine dehydrogenase family protein molybdopterin-binding subunit [Paraburkholderia domus]MBK5047891.1 xanthine dehydrogenase family protein molybdopterin-binding subunit [Burkholderia sp. R-70006]MBK5063297.1 xanthine dehydrogenase family protein molybdopterin-binding subunit [Burkholderia sp. R-70199]MBK5084606.1 xanthine dehydrogenase family protein molybdopterin-binding subunit [Burkholderia sp. R-69927]MBK5120063.1 xanthine dehydrogenase family protein molybdopterin-binding subunit [B